MLLLAAARVILWTCSHMSHVKRTESLANPVDASGSEHRRGWRGMCVFCCEVTRHVV